MVLRRSQILLIGVLSAGCSTGDGGLDAGEKLDTSPDGDSILPSCTEVVGVPVESSGSLVVPEHAVSIAIQSVVFGDVRLTTERLIGPAGDLVVEGWFGDSETSICLSCPARVGLDRGVHSVLVPGSPSAEKLFVPGHWEHAVRLLDSGASPAVTAFAKVGPEPQTGLLALDVYVTGATPDDLAGALQEVAELYAGVGITVSASTRDSGSASPNARVETLRADLFDQVESTGDAIAVFLVDGLSDASGQGYTGLSPVVGPIGDAASASGVVVRGSVDDLGGAMAHEIGHYLGLWHTFEPFPNDDIKDPLPDTAIFDDGNVMTPRTPGDVFTEGQGAVMRRHPMVRHPCVGENQETGR